MIECTVLQSISAGMIFLSEKGIVKQSVTSQRSILYAFDHLAATD